MSRSPSPASSLDFVDSDPSGSEDEYQPVARPKAPPKPQKAAGGGGAAARPSSGIKINLTALQRAREVQAAHPADTGEEAYEEYQPGEDEEGGFLGGEVVGPRVVDLSSESLKADHSSRPLWIDGSGNM